MNQLRRFVEFVLSVVIVWSASAGRLCASEICCLSVSSPRIVESANYGWLFQSGECNGAESVDFDDSGWESVDLPHDFQVYQPWVEPAPDERPDVSNPAANIKSRLSARGFKEMGCGWYRKKFTPPAEWRDRRVLIDFEGIMLVGDVYLNGLRIGGTDYGYLGFEIDLSGLLLFDRPNVIAVKAETGNPGNSRWYTGAGLYRDVSFIVTDPSLYFTRHPLHITTPDVSADAASIVVDGEIATYIKGEKELTVGVDVIDPAGVNVYSEITTHRFRRNVRVRELRLDSIRLENIRLWDVSNPKLYTIVATLYRPDGSVADCVKQHFGIRSIDYSPEFGFRLNGKKLLLKGIANHHTLGALGACAYPAAEEKRIRLLKEFGFNHIRTSHNPYSESFLSLCDRYGILVVDELYDKWTRKSSGGRTEWMDRWSHDIPEWIRRDRNHPSVVMWSLGNELQMISDLPFNDWGVTPYKLQKTLLNRYDDTRPVTVAMHPRGRNEMTDSLPAPLALVTDIASYNYRYGYFPGDSRNFPWMIFYQSEANTSNMGPNYFDMDLERVVGLAYWGMIDYFGESQGWPAKGWTNGVFDVSLEPKPMAYFLRSIFRPDEPLVRIAMVESESNDVWNDVKVGTKQLSSDWDYATGSRRDIYTFTNADEVELIVGGRSLGRRLNNRLDSSVRNRILWRDIVCMGDTVEARAYNYGSEEPVAVHREIRSGRAVGLVAEIDNPDWSSDGRDLQHIRVTAADADGRIDVRADIKLHFAVEGPARIVGVINGDMSSSELTVGDTRSLYRGTCVVILRAGHNPGEVKLTITPEGSEIPSITLPMELL